jgi:hypothetical protein
MITTKLKPLLVTAATSFLLGAVAASYLLLAQGEAIGTALVGAGIVAANAAQRPVFTVSAGTALTMPTVPVTFSKGKR